MKKLYAFKMYFSSILLVASIGVHVAIFIMALDLEFSISDSTLNWLTYGFIIGFALQAIFYSMRSLKEGDILIALAMYGINMIVVLTCWNTNNTPNFGSITAVFFWLTPILNGVLTFVFCKDYFENK